MRQIIVALIFLVLIPTASLSQASTKRGTQQRQTSGQTPSIEQINEPVRLRHLSTESVPDANHLVNLSFAVELNTTKPIRSFRVHFEQEFEDHKITSAPLVVTSETTIDKSSPNQQVVRFSCRRAAKAKVWVSIVEFEDGNTWKAEMAKVAEAQGRTN